MRIFLVDSYIMNGYDISYYNDSCELLSNNRLSITVNIYHHYYYIVQMLMIFFFTKSTRSAVTAFVGHLNPIQLFLFKHHLIIQTIIDTISHCFDKLGNTVHINHSEETVIILEE